MTRRTSRRSVLTGIGAAGIAGLAGCISGSGDDGTAGGTASGTLSVGVMQPLTGPINYYGQQSLWGFLSGLAHKLDTDPPEVDSAGQVTMEGDSVTYELYIEDTAFKPDQAQDVATDLVNNQDVDVLFGLANSGSARQVISNVVKNEELPALIGPAASAGITASGNHCSEWVFRANENTAMDARSGGRYVANETDTDSVFIMAADYSFGKAVAQNYATVLKNNGVEVADIRYVPREYSEFGGVFDEAEQTDADAVIGGFTFLTLPNFLTTALQYDFRIFGGFATLITNKAIGGVVQNELGEDFTAQDIKDAKLGPFTTRYHWNQYDNDINNSFVETYSSAYGTVPDLFTSGTFVAASSLVQAVNAEGSLEREAIKNGLTGMTVTDTPKGENAYTYQEYNNQARSEMTIAYPVPTQDEWADRWAAPVQPGEPIASISGEDATIPADSSEMNCDL